MALVELTDAKEWLDVTGASTDTLIQRLVDASLSMAERFTRRTFTSASRTEDVDGRGTGAIVISSPPITVLTSVSIIDDGGGVTLVPVTEYRAENESGVIRIVGSSLVRTRPLDGEGFPIVSDGPADGFAFSGRFPEGVANVRIEYTGGWSDGTFPDDLRQAILEMTSELWHTRAQDPGLASERLGDYQLSRFVSKERAGRFRALLAPYRRPLLR